MSTPNESVSQTSAALVIGGVAYGDRSRVVRLLTRDHGLVPLWVLNASKNKGLWHPMAMVEAADLHLSKGRGLWVCKEWRRMHPQLAYRRSPERAAVGFFVAEVLSACLEEAAPAPEVYDLAMQVAEWLESEAEVSWIHVRFMSELVHVLGMLPPLPPAYPHAFDIQSGDFVPVEQASPHTLDASVVQGFREILGMDFGVLARHNWTRNQRKQLVLGAFKYVQAQLGRNRELKSYDVLEALFA